MLDKVLVIYHYIIGPAGAVIFGALLSVSEALALSPKVKANSIFQAVVNSLKWILSKIKPQA
jgi:hypothetical protein